MNVQNAKMVCVYISIGVEFITKKKFSHENFFFSVLYTTYAGQPYMRHISKNVRIHGFIFVVFVRLINQKNKNKNNEQLERNMPFWSLFGAIVTKCVCMCVCVGRIQRIKTECKKKQC